ncbi:hypothetical protein N6H14_04910 [Paenibacillus sp. CC-CFT747]|nr:hypothetical protein N6H14_04910 [Paenibacillus sp. CC-CFT747]
MWLIQKGEAGGHPVFLRLLVPNLLFLLLPLLVGWVIYHQTLIEMEKEVTTANFNLLQQNREILDRRLQELSSIAMQLTEDTRIMQFQRITEPYQGANVNRVLETRKSLYHYGLANNFIFKYFILFKNSNLVFTEDSTYSYPEFYRNFRYEGWEEDAFRNELVSVYRHKRFSPPKRSS